MLLTDLLLGLRNNSCESLTPGGPYALAAISPSATGARPLEIDLRAPAPNATCTVFLKPFAHAAHVWRENDGKGALVMAVEGQDDVSYPKGVPQNQCGPDGSILV